jgi:hypothetical protein
MSERLVLSGPFLERYSTLPPVHKTICCKALLRQNIRINPTLGGAANQYG